MKRLRLALFEDTTDETLHSYEMPYVTDADIEALTGMFTRQLQRKKEEEAQRLGESIQDEII